MAKDKNPKVAGQILDVGGERIAIIRGPLADALDINNWNIVSDTTTKRPRRKRQRQSKSWKIGSATSKRTRPSALCSAG